MISFDYLPPHEDLAGLGALVALLAMTLRWLPRRTRRRVEEASPGDVSKGSPRTDDDAFFASALGDKDLNSFLEAHTVAPDE